VLEYWSGEKATEEWLRRAPPYQKTDVQAKAWGATLSRADLLHPPSFHSSSRQRAGGTQARMPVRPAGFYPAEGKQASSLFGAQTWKSNVPPRPDNEPLKNGNRATA